MIQRLRDSLGYLIGITVIGQIISFFRESIFAYYYGTSYQADAYVMASQIPITLFAVVTASINTVILPIYTSIKESAGDEMADKSMNSFLFVFELMCLLLTIISFFFARYIVFIFAPAFSGELLDLTIRYVRLLFPTILFSSLINILTVRFYVKKQFSYPQYVGLFQNVAIICMMLAFAQKMSTDAVVIGTVLGLALNALFLLIPSWQMLRRGWQIRGLGKSIRRVILRAIPVACGVGIAEINRIVDRAIASGLDTGSITGLNYANKLAVVFSALIVTALSTVCFQQFSSLYAKELFQERFRELKNYIIVLVYILLPLTCVVLILKRDLIMVVFARGAFGLESVNLTASVFFYYSIGILPIALREILSKYYYSSGDTKTPMINAAVGVTVNIVLNIILSRFMGASGLALATTISYIIVCLLLLISILRKEQRSINDEFILDCLPAICASIIMSIIVSGYTYILNLHNSFLNLFLGSFIGLVSYSLVCYFFAPKQIGVVFNKLFRRM